MPCSPLTGHIFSYNGNMKKLIFITLCVIFLTAGVIGYFTLTASGARVLLHQVISHYVKQVHVNPGQLSGNLLNGLTFENLELTHIQGLPAESTLRIQRLFIKMDSFKPEGFQVEIVNCRLRLKQSDPIVMEGSFKNGAFDLNIFGPSLGLNEFKEFIYTAHWLKPVSGHVKDFDIYVKGSYKKPQIRGEAFAEELTRKKITLVNVPVRFYFNLNMENIERDSRGYVFVKEGELHSRQTTVTLKESRIIFDHDWENPRLNLRGHSKIEDVEINIRITGTRLFPDIQLTSLPPLPREGLMIMLATGKRWQGVEGVLSTGTLSPEVATDFLDFFFFGGRGQKMGQRFGIKEIDVTFKEGTQGIGVTKTITDKVSVELEKKTATQEETNTLETGVNKVESENKVMLKFETKF